MSLSTQGSLTRIFSSLLLSPGQNAPVEEEVTRLARSAEPEVSRYHSFRTSSSDSHFFSRSIHPLRLENNISHSEEAERPAFTNPNTPALTRIFGSMLSERTEYKEDADSRKDRSVVSPEEKPLRTLLEDEPLFSATPCAMADFSYLGKLSPGTDIFIKSRSLEERRLFSTYTQAQDSRTIFGSGHIAHCVEAEIMLCLPRGASFKTDPQIAVFQHYKDKIKGAGSRIGFTAFMNGINVSEEEFKKCGRAIHEQVKQQTITIGLFNRSQGFPLDVVRIGAEKAHLVCTRSISMMRSFLETTAAFFYNRRIGIGSQAPFLMIVHSEGGLILYNAMKELNEHDKELIKGNMHVITCGSVRPIPNKYGKSVKNFYSKKDYAVKPFIRSYENRSDYNITLACCVSEASERILWLIDHTFLGTTYQKCLKVRIEELNSTVGFGTGALV